MKLLTKSIRDQLLRNGRLRSERERQGRDEVDFIPVVKLFTSDAGCTWRLSELDPEDPSLPPNASSALIEWTPEASRRGDPVLAL